MAQAPATTPRRRADGPTPAIELTLLSRVAFRDQEITGPRLRGLLALLAERRRQLLLGERWRPGQRAEAARRTLEAFEQRELPYLQVLAHARISELCLQVERGEEA